MHAATDEEAWILVSEWVSDWQGLKPEMLPNLKVEKKIPDFACKLVSFVLIQACENQFDKLKQRWL